MDVEFCVAQPSPPPPLKVTDAEALTGSEKVMSNCTAVEALQAPAPVHPPLLL
jgi:hypothetical protein